MIIKIGRNVISYKFEKIYKKSKAHLCTDKAEARFKMKTKVVNKSESKIVNLPI